MITMYPHGFITIRKVEKMVDDPKHWQVFAENKINEVGYKNFSATFFSPGLSGYCRFDTYPEDAEILGNYADGTVSSLLINTSKKGKWAVLGYALWKTTIPTFQKQRLCNIFDALSPLCVRVSPEYQATVFCRVNKISGKTMAVNYLNPTIERQCKVKLLIRNAQSDNFVFANASGTEKLVATKVDGGFEVILPCVQPWSVVTVFCKI